MGRGIAGVVAGLVAWVAFATAANVALRMSLPGYAEAEPAMKFTAAMMIGRLAVGAASCVVAGAVAAWIAKGKRWVPATLGAILIGSFIPVHIGLWDRFPIWYHVVFLVSLLPLTVAGAKLTASHGSPAVGRSA